MQSFDIIQWIIAGGVFWLLWRGLRGIFGRSGPSLVCTSCGHSGPARIRTRGSIWIEVVLWLCLIVPGLVYSIWRLTTRGNACAMCGAATLVPAQSPVGRKILAEQSAPRDPA